MLTPARALIEKIVQDSQKNAEVLHISKWVDDDVAIVEVYDAEDFDPKEPENCKYTHLAMGSVAYGGVFTYSRRDNALNRNVEENFEMLIVRAEGEENQVPIHATLEALMGYLMSGSH